MTNDEARALIEGARKHFEFIRAEMPECMCGGEAGCSSWCPRASWSGIADSAESWMRTNLRALLDGYSSALDAAASWAISTLETSNEYHRRHLEAMAESDRLRASNETLVRHRQVTQDQLDKFMSACADQTIQIMELRGEVRRLRDGRSGAAPISDVRLREIEVMCEAATPGPWRWGDWRTDFGLLESEFRLTLEHNPTHGAAPDQVARNHNETGCRRILEVQDEIDNPADAMFIAASRSIIPELLSEIRDLRDDVTAADERMAGVLDGTFAVGDGTAQRSISRLRAENVDLVAAVSRLTMESVERGARVRDMADRIDLMRHVVEAADAWQTCTSKGLGSHNERALSDAVNALRSRSAKP
jgi:hypothetical protein